MEAKEWTFGLSSESWVKGGRTFVRLIEEAPPWFKVG